MIAPHPVATGRVIGRGQPFLAGVAAVVSAYRAVRTDSPEIIVAAAFAAALALAAAKLSLAGGRRALAPLVLALAMEFTILWAAAPPRLINAVPLIFAIALGFTSVPRTQTTDQLTERSRALSVTTAVSLVLLAPIGIFYLAMGLIAPVPDVFVSYLLYVGVVTIAVALSRRRSWWVAIMPPAALGLLLVMVQVGVALRDWSG
jgi:hypothetical protein